MSDTDNNDFQNEEFMDMLMSMVYPELDLDETINCDKCGEQMEVRKSAPISYDDEQGEKQIIRLCMSCFEKFVKQEEELKREHILWFLKGDNGQ